MLKTIHDILEAQRTFRRCRDLSPEPIIQNASAVHLHSMKPQEGHVSENWPVYIENILNRDLQPRGQHRASGLLLDPDRELNIGADYIDEPNILEGRPMPALTGEAKLLYIQAYGQERYDQFAEKSSFTCHGAIPPSDLPDPLPVFVHRPCHDAESIFWTMFAAILHAQPASGTREPWASKRVAELWKKLHEHEIPDNPADYDDHREDIFHTLALPWARYFHPDLRDVAQLLYDIRCQVAPEYEYWTPRPPDDHLHEALQRLILQYLVEHRDKDIALDPDHLRPTQSAYP
ncbi:hypothetical protein K466DRAFT_655990 [Polyporus arcularius HHB13444]|uniref:Fungal-type protein kinase domain-containing protein n=1 Tax=Polyporus arcularius HHB13444 TaxID=1314778 RepID=A0A5C3NWR1_9APHY|nr:hypothetical protein K466DRAFT_655990 [Polyporus arcularius HHB13444]